MSRTYRLMAPADLPVVTALVRAARLTWEPAPSVAFLAEEAGQIVGVLGLDFSGDLVVAGPLAVARSHARTFCAFRLVEMLEAWLAMHGATAYVFSVGTKNAAMLHAAERLGAERYATHARTAWFVRRLGTYRGREEVT